MAALSKRLSGVVILALAAGYLWMASQIEITRFVQMTQVIDSRLFPFILGTILTILAIILIVKPDEDEEGGFTLNTWFYVGIILVSILAYAYVMVPLGYILATSLLLLIQFMLLGAKPLWAVLVAVAVSLSLYVLFVYGLDVVLPKGKLF